MNTFKCAHRAFPACFVGSTRRNRWTDRRDNRHSNVIITIIIFILTVVILGRLKMHDLKIQDWKMTDNFARNRRVWKMQDWKMTDHVN